MALYPMAIRSDDDKWRTCPYLQASQTSISSSMRLLVVKLLFHLKHGLLLQSSIEQVASLNVRPVFASNDLLSVLFSFFPNT
jgi:hypothetical protein